MSEKKKSASQSEMAEPKARVGEREREQKSAKATARERETRENKPVRRETKQAARGGQSRWRNRALVRFAREAYQELRFKVTWPTFQEARNMTIAVVALSAAAGVVLGLADAGLFQLFRLITGK